MPPPQPPRFDGQRWSNADDDRLYAETKHALARRHPTDREAYTRGKDEVVARILGRALAPNDTVANGGREGSTIQGARG